MPPKGGCSIMFEESLMLMTDLSVEVSLLAIIIPASIMLWIVISEDPD